MTLILVVLVEKVIGLRIKAEDEMGGLDHVCHGEHGYGMLSPN